MDSSEYLRWPVSLAFNISENKHVLKNVTTDITINSKVLIDKQKKFIVKVDMSLLNANLTDHN